MLYKKIIVYSALMSSLHAGYLEGLIHKDSSNNTQEEKGNVSIKDKNITSEKEMSHVLLSFEKEEENKIKIHKRKQEELKKAQMAQKEAKEREKQKKAQMAQKQKKKRAFPSLSEQLAEFGGDGDEQAVNPLVDFNHKKTFPPKVKRVIYGVFCKAGKCYGLGEHKIYKEGDSVNKIKIMEITKNFIRFKNGKKIWYTR